jgi:hypothetical protein
MPPRYTVLRITVETHRKLRILAANSGESMIGLIDRLATEEAQRKQEKWIREPYPLAPPNEPTE